MEIRERLVAAIQGAVRTLRETNSDLCGFALCTDDDVRTLYHVACTREWVREKEKDYPDIGFLCVEWTLTADNAAFDAISREFDRLADEPDSDPRDWSEARDRRFELLVLALADCRSKGTFSSDVFVCAASTDPSDHLEKLTMKAVDALNARALADGFARAFGYQRHKGRY